MQITKINRKKKEEIKQCKKLIFENCYVEKKKQSISEKKKCLKEKNKCFDKLGLLTKEQKLCIYKCKDENKLQSRKK